MITFRDYQIIMIENTIAAYRNGIKRAQIYAPTGAGKTNVFIEDVRQMLIDDPRTRVLFVHPRIALSADQQRRVMDEHGIDGLECHVFHSGGSIKDEQITDDQNHNIATTNRETLENVLKIAKVPVAAFTTYHSAHKIIDLFDVVIFDEAHYLVNATAKRILPRISPRTSAFFFTATPVHASTDSGMGMNNETEFGPVIAKVLPSVLIERGYICQPKLLKASVSLSNINSATGEPVADPITLIPNALHDQHIRVQADSNGKIVTKMLVTMDNTQVFKEIRRKHIEMIRTAGIDFDLYTVSASECYHNGMYIAKREDCLNSFKDNRKVCVILHFDTLAEGIDINGITGVLINRNISTAKFIQTAGRAARPAFQDLVNGEPVPLDLRVKPNYYITVPVVDGDDFQFSECKKWIEALKAGGYGDFLTMSTPDDRGSAFGSDDIDNLFGGDDDDGFSDIDSFKVELIELDLTRFFTAA